MLVALAIRLKTFLLSLNLFAGESRDINIERLERLSTRIYLILLAISFIILLTYTAVAEQTSTITVEFPSQTTIERLFEEYPDSLNCPCSNIAILYDNIIEVDVTYHQICSSPFITPDWIKNSYLVNTSYIWPRDIRTLASAYAQILASLCSISKWQIDAAQSALKSSSLITANVMRSSLISAQVQNQINIFNQTVTEEMSTLQTGIQVIIRGNQLLSGLQTGNVWTIDQSNYTDMTLFTESIWYQYDGLANVIGCLCDTITYCNVQAYFYPDVRYDPIVDYGESTYNGTRNPIKIDGWRAACYPIQALYVTTLNCYYNETCISLLLDSSTKTIPVLNMEQNKTRFGSPDVSLFRTLINNLFVEQFHQTVFFENFLRECAPRFCTHLLTHKPGFLQIISTILGLFGGMSTALELFIGQIVLRILRWRYRRSLTRVTSIINDDNNAVRTGSIFNKLQRLSQSLRSKIVELNFFSTNSIIGRERIERQRWTTRVFLFLLAIVLFILIIYTALEEHNKVITISTPNQSEYENLLNIHPSIRCPCTSISIKYEQFLSTSPTFHQICSSSFRNWNFYQWLYASVLVDALDFRSSAVSYFTLLQHLCAQVEITVEEAYHHFVKKEYITDVLLTPEIFDIEAHALINALIKKTTDQFALSTQTTRELTAASQFISLYQTSSSSIVTSDYKIYLTQNDFHSDRLFSNESCFCGRNLICQRAAAFYHENTHDLIEIIDGLIISCLPYESLLASSFVCFYNETCVNRTFSWFDGNEWDRAYGLENRIYRPMLNSSVKSRYNQTSTVEEIIYDLFVEEWNAQYSYSAFFTSCNVSYCSYSSSERNSILMIITTLIGLFGGLNVALQLILPFVINLLMYCKNKLFPNNPVLAVHHDNQTQNTEHGNMSFFVRIKMKIITLNLFAENNDDDNINDMDEINKQRLFTRIYVVLLSTILLIFIIYYSFIIQYTSSVTIDKPSITKFEQIQDLYSNTLHCPSSHIAINYESFTRINYTIHQICSSQLISTTFTDFLYHFTQHPLKLIVKDFRMQAVYLFHVLRALCFLSQSSLDVTINEFMRTQLITTEVLSRQRFDLETKERFDALRHSISTTFILNLNLFRTSMQGNQLQTLSMSNWKFHVIGKKTFDNVQTLPLTYGKENCSCATSNKCFESAKMFLENNDTINITGILVGCTPLEALLNSTLTSFFNQTFIDYLITMLIQHSPDITVDFTPPNALNKSVPTRFKDTDSIEMLVNNSFIEFLNITGNYSNYYETSQPNRCIYSYTTRNDAVFVVSTLLGLYGGLTVTLHFIVPYFVTFVIRVKRFFCERRTAINVVTPVT